MQYLPSVSLLAIITVAFGDGLIILVTRSSRLSIVDVILDTYTINSSILSVKPSSTMLTETHSSELIPPDIAENVTGGMLSRSSLVAALIKQRKEYINTATLITSS